MKTNNERWRLRAFISIAMYPAISSCDEQVFDNMNEESEKKNFIIRKSLPPVLTQGIVEQAEQNGDLRPHRGREVSEDMPDKGYN